MTGDDFIKRFNKLSLEYKQKAIDGLTAALETKNAGKWNEQEINATEKLIEECQLIIFDKLSLEEKVHAVVILENKNDNELNDRKIRITKELIEKCKLKISQIKYLPSDGDN